ncbi:hypothetical protein ACJMK2_035099 [Sinanodonta woodiana]|uniref:Rap1 GTPase-GDP dissociation stimulator 1 n=1 Tax=Sinanodonta woodiana TaxID=1069815 RepID=A0ABD3WV86_SINWO
MPTALNILKLQTALKTASNNPQQLHIALNIGLIENGDLVSSIATMSAILKIFGVKCLLLLITYLVTAAISLVTNVNVGREVVDASNGIEILLKLLKSSVKNTKTDADKLRTIACGFLLNLTNTHDVLQEKAISEGAFDVLEQYLAEYFYGADGISHDDGLCNMVLVTIISITDTESCKEKLLQSTLLKTLSECLGSPKCGDHTATVLDLLLNLGEWDEVKDYLAGTELSNHLIRLIQSNTGRADENSHHIVKMASDLLILLLTGEKSMELLFAKGDGPIFVESMKWLESDDEHLQLSGALAVGNFARSDEHCQKLVEEGLVDVLVQVLWPDGQPNSSVSVQHATLSALRNLAIPAANKSTLIKAGVVEKVLTLVNTEVHAVTFKLLGVLRMLVDGQAETARQLGIDREFVTQLVEWAGIEEHPGVKGEASRLLAWLIKNSRSEDVMRNIVRLEGIQHLVPMATSEHVVMQNEALMALTLISSTVLADAAVAMKEADLTNIIVTILKDEKTLPEILCNALTLTKAICTAASPSQSQMISCSLLACAGFLSDMENSLKEEMATSGILDIVRTLTSHEDTKVQEGALSLLVLVEDTADADR